MKRICSQCGIEKPIERFAKQHGKYRYDPYRKDCKDCRNYKRRNKIKSGPKSWNRGKGKGRWTVNYHKWRNAVLERDNFQCQKCEKGDVLHCHHIKPWKEFPDLRFDINNGETLCRKCHISYESKERAKKGDSPETTKRKREAHLGKAPWNYGKRMKIPEERQCKDCMETKNIKEFRIHQGYWYGHSCKKCTDQKTIEKRRSQKCH